MPLQLARRKGRADIEVVLLRAGAPGSEGFARHCDLLVDYLYELCDDLACAGWLQDWEFLLWAAITGEPPMSAGSPFLEAVDEDTKADLRFLASACGGWVCYGERGPEFIGKGQWAERYQLWRAQHT